MSIRVNLPDGRVVNFPDGMAPQDIKKAIGEIGGGDKPAAPKQETSAPAPFRSESGFRGIEAIGDAVRAIPDVARNLFNSETRGATLGGFKQGAAAGARDLGAALKTELGGAKDTAAGVAEMVKHPGDAVRALGGMAVDTAKAVPGLLSADTRRESGKKIAETLTGVSADQVKADPLRAFGGALAMVAGARLGSAAVRGGRRVVQGQRAARAGAAAEQAAARAEALRVARGLAGDVPDEVVARGLAEGPKPVAAPPKPRLVEGVRRTAEDEMADALAEVRRDLVKADLPESVEAPPPPFSAGSPQPPAQPRVSVPGRRVGGKAAKVKKTAPAPAEPTAAAPVAPETVASESPVAPREARQAVGREGEAASGPAIKTVASGMPVTIKPKAGVVGELRRAVGSEKAARALGIGKDDVKRAAPGPSRRPLAAEVAELDNDYMRQIANERGAVDPKLALKIGLPVAGAAYFGGTAEEGNGVTDAIAGGLLGAAVANPGAVKRGAGAVYRKAYKPTRMIGMLSGAALPKSVLGNVGAFVNASIDNGTTAPLKQLAKPDAILKDIGQAWKQQANPADRPFTTDGSFISRFNVPGRLMGAMDQASENALIRSGLTKTEAQRQLLTSPGALEGELGRQLSSELGQHLVPFQRIPVNTVAQGIAALRELAPSNGATRLQKAATAGAIGTGAAAATQTQDPVTLALIAALMGRRALPLTVGAMGTIAATKGPSATRFLGERMGTGIPDISLGDVVYPMRPITNPAIINWLKYLNGEKRK